MKLSHSSSHPGFPLQREKRASGPSVVLPRLCPKELGLQYLGCEKYLMKAKLNKLSKGRSSFAKFTSQTPCGVTYMHLNSLGNYFSFKIW